MRLTILSLQIVTKVNSGTERLANLRVAFSTTSLIWLRKIFSEENWFNLFMDFTKFIILDYDVDDS